MTACHDRALDVDVYARMLVAAGIDPRQAHLAKCVICRAPVSEDDDNGIESPHSGASREWLCRRHRAAVIRVYDDLVAGRSTATSNQQTEEQEQEVACPA